MLSRVYTVNRCNNLLYTTLYLGIFCIDIIPDLGIVYSSSANPQGNIPLAGGSAPLNPHGGGGGIPSVP